MLKVSLCLVRRLKPLVLVPRLSHEEDAACVEQAVQGWRHARAVSGSHGPLGRPVGQFRAIPRLKPVFSDEKSTPSATI